MKSAVVAIGSNVGERHRQLVEAHNFLKTLSKGNYLASAIYLTEPVGPSERYFLNAAVQITTVLSPQALLKKCQHYEQHHGRPATHPRWEARTIDLDIICFDDLVIQQDNLIIPHPEYGNRLFVLKPLKDICPNWRDPQKGQSVDAMIDRAPPLQIKRTTLKWEYGK